MGLGSVGKPDASSTSSLIDDAYAAIAPGPAAPPPTPPCRVCGSRPTAAVRFRMVAGLVWITRQQREAGPFCRDCGIAVFRLMTARTLSSAWWGPVSFVLAPFVLARNGLARRRVAALAAPQDPARGHRPMRVGAPVYRRRQITGLLAPLALVAAIVSITLTTSNGSGSGTDNGSCVEVDQVYVGVIADGAVGEIVGCDQPHVGRIDPSESPVNGSCDVYLVWTVMIGSTAYCVAPTTS